MPFRMTKAAPRFFPALDSSQLRPPRMASSVLTPPASSTRAIVCHFLLRLLDAVILDVDIKSPMYFCRNLLWLSSLSCSSLTASIRLKRMTSDSCSAFACLRSCQLACPACPGRPSHACYGQGIHPNCFDSPLQLLPCLLAERLNVLTRSPGAHGPHVVRPSLHLNRPDGCGLARHDHGAAALAAR